jgi:hypothetical protein
MGTEFLMQSEAQEKINAQDLALLARRMTTVESTLNLHDEQLAVQRERLAAVEARADTAHEFLRGLVLQRTASREVWLLRIAFVALFVLGAIKLLA